MGENARQDVIEQSAKLAQVILQRSAGEQQAEWAYDARKTAVHGACRIFQTVALIDGDSVKQERFCEKSFFGADHVKCCEINVVCARSNGGVILESVALRLAPMQFDDGKLWRKSPALVDPILQYGQWRDDEMRPGQARCFQMADERKGLKRFTETHFIAENAARPESVSVSV